MRNKVFKRYISMATLIFFLFSSISTIFPNSVGSDGDDAVLTESPELAFTYQNSVVDLGNIKEGEAKTFTFQIWNNKTINIDDYNNGTLQVDTLSWNITIPFFFESYVTVSPMSGSSDAPTYNQNTGKWEYDKKTVTVTVATKDMLWGLYRCKIIIDCGNFSGFLEVKWSIGTSLSYGIDDQREIFLTMGKPEKKTITLDIWNGGFGELEYTLSKQCYSIEYHIMDPSYSVPARFKYEFRSNWVQLSTNKGVSNGEHDEIEITIDTSTLKEWTLDNSIGYRGKYYPGFGEGPWGLYECYIKIESNAINPPSSGGTGRGGFPISDGKGVFKITLEVRPEIRHDPARVDFGDITHDGGVKTASFDIYNNVNGTINWEILIPEDIQYYVSVLPMSGTSMGPDDRTTVTVTIDPGAKLEEEDFDGLMSIYRYPGEYAMPPGFHDEFIQIKSNDVKSHHPIKYNTGNSPEWPTFNFNYYLTMQDKNETCDMLIITPSYFLEFPYSVDPEYSLYDLKEAHETADEFNLKIKTIKEIWDEYRDYRPGFSRFLYSRYNMFISLAIREYLRDAYFHLNDCSEKSFYVLLVGDDDYKMTYRKLDDKDRITHPDVYPDDIMWMKYYENLDFGWLKIGDAPPESNIVVGNIMDMAAGHDKKFDPYLNWGDDNYWAYTVEFPTFQIPYGPSAGFDYDACKIEHVWNENDGKMESIKEYKTVSWSIPYTVASDMPYACLGSRSRSSIDVEDSVGFVKLNDNIVDVYVGRAPVRSAKELSNFVYKTIQYIKSPVTDEYLNAVVASEHLGMKCHKDWESYQNEFWGGSGLKPGDCTDCTGNPVNCPSYYPSSSISGYEAFMWNMKKQTIDGVSRSGPLYTDSDNLGRSLTGHEYFIPESYQYAHKTVGIPSDKFNIFKLHDLYVKFTPGGAKAPRVGWMGYNHPLTNTPALSDLINEGVGLINHVGHSYRPKRGSNDYYTGDPVYSEKDEYRVLRLYSSVIEDGYFQDINHNIIGEHGLKNTVYPIIFSLGCYGGQFDNGYARQIGEQLLVDENGMVAGIFSGVPMPANEYEAMKFDRYFWDAVFGEPKNKGILGKCFYDSKSLAGLGLDDLFYGLNLFGDPALCVKGTDHKYPNATIATNYTEPVNVSESVLFLAGGAFDRLGNQLSCEWDFGDGSKSNQLIIAHSYSEPGTYEVVLTITDEELGESDTDTMLIVVENPDGGEMVDDDGDTDGESDGETDDSSSDSEDGTSDQDGEDSSADETDTNSNDEENDSDEDSNNGSDNGSTDDENESSEDEEDDSDEESNEDIISKIKKLIQNLIHRQINLMDFIQELSNLILT